MNCNKNSNSWMEQYEEVKKKLNDRDETIDKLEKKIRELQNEEDFVAYQENQRFEESALGRFRYSLLVRLAAKYDLTFKLNFTNDYHLYPIYGRCYVVFHVFYRGEEPFYIGEHLLGTLKNMNHNRQQFENSIMRLTDDTEFSQYLLYWNSQIKNKMAEEKRIAGDYDGLLKEI